MLGKAAVEFAALDADVAASVDSSDATVRLELVAATTLSNLLAKYKRLCDVLLPALRSRSHLFNVIHRHKTNYSCVASDVASGRVLGGCTFRVVRAGDENSARLIAEVLLLAVDQRAGVCGRGHGTRLINFVKGLVLRAAAAEGSEPFVLTQSDIGEQARAFWSRQQLQESEEATALVRAMAAWDKKSCIVYNYTVPMLAPLLESSWRCEPHESARAQRTLEDDEDADDDDDDDAGGALRCDVCSQWKRADAAGGGREAFTCADCRGLMQRSGVAAPPEPEPEAEPEAEDEAEAGGGRRAAGGRRSECRSPTARRPAGKRPRGLAARGRRRSRAGGPHAAAAAAQRAAAAARGVRGTAPRRDARWGAGPVCSLRSRGRRRRQAARDARGGRGGEGLATEADVAAGSARGCDAVRGRRRRRRRGRRGGRGRGRGGRTRAGRGVARAARPGAAAASCGAFRRRAPHPRRRQPARCAACAW